MVSLAGSVAECELCKTEFAKKTRWHRSCSKRCADKLRQLRRGGRILPLIPPPDSEPLSREHRNAICYRYWYATAMRFRVDKRDFDQTVQLVLLLSDGMGMRASLRVTNREMRSLFKSYGIRPMNTGKKTEWMVREVSESQLLRNILTKKKTEGH